MDIISFMNKVNAVGKYFIITVFALNLMTLASAGAEEDIETTLTELCEMSQTFLGLAAMLLIVLAGTTYAIGQVLGAETRARASVWATAMMTGAIIGILIYVLTPMLVARLLGQEAQDSPCDFAIG